MFGFELVDIVSLPDRKLFDAVFDCAKSNDGYCDYIILNLKNKLVKFFVCYKTKNQAKIARNIMKSTCFQSKNKIFRFTYIPDVCEIIELGDKLAVIPIDY